MSLFLLLAGLMVCAPALAADSIGEVDAVTGDCRIIRDGDSLAAKLRQAVMRNDEIATGEGARISILFRDETILTLDESSQASLDDYVYNEDAANLLFKFTKGTFRAITGEIVERNPEGFNIETPVVTIGIRGSDIYAIVQPEGEETGALHLGEGHALEVMSATYAVRITQGGLRVKVSPDGIISEPMRIPDDMFDKMLHLGSATPSGTSAQEEPVNKPIKKRTIRPAGGAKSRAETLQNLSGSMGGASSGGTMPSPGSVNSVRGATGSTGTGGTTSGNPVLNPVNSLRGTIGTTGSTGSTGATTTTSPSTGTTTTRSPATGTTATGSSVTGSTNTNSTLSNPSSLSSRGTTGSTSSGTTTDNSTGGSTTTRGTSTTTTAPTLKKSTVKPVLKAKPTTTIR